MKIYEAVKIVEERIRPAALEEANQQARIIISFVMKCSISELLLRLNDEFPEKYWQEVLNHVSKRESGMPIQYIIGTWDFMGFGFRVSPNALIPRQDTETLVEAAIDLARRNEYMTALDLCCGTGCIGISLNLLASLNTTCCDISDKCVELTCENAKRLGAEVTAVKSDLFENIWDKYDLIVSNPPYIPTGDIEMLQREVKHEPMLALDGGKDGLDFYRRIAADYYEHLTQGGAMLLEVGIGQAQAVVNMLGKRAYVIKDLTGTDRVVALIKRSNKRVGLRKI